MYLGGMGVSIFIAMSGFLEAYKYSEKEPSNALGIVYFKWRKFFWLHIVTLIMSLPLSLHQLVLRHFSAIGSRLHVPNCVLYVLGFLFSYLSAYILHNRDKLLGELRDE